MKSTLTRHLVFTVAIALLAVAAAPSGAALGHWDRITFSGPVALPGRAPGRLYTFEIANPASSLRWCAYPGATRAGSTSPVSPGWSRDRWAFRGSTP
jgi:hypothetical protein